MGADLGGFASRIELRMLSVMCDRMEPQPAVDADHGCTYAFGYVGDFAVYGYVQEHLAVIAYDNKDKKHYSVSLPCCIGFRLRSSEPDSYEAKSHKLLAIIILPSSNKTETATKTVFQR